MFKERRVLFSEVNWGFCSNSVKVANFAVVVLVNTILPNEKISIGPSKDDFGLFEPLAMASTFPFSLVKKVTIWEVSE